MLVFTSHSIDYIKTCITIEADNFITVQERVKSDVWELT